MKKMDGQTLDIVAERIEELRAVFPEVFKDGKIDFDMLQNALGAFGLWRSARKVAFMLRLRWMLRTKKPPLWSARP